MDSQVSTFTTKKGLAQMLKGGVIMDVVTADHAKIAEEAGAVAVMALERVPADIRADGGVARMSAPEHVTVVVGGDHTGMQCTECHQPHSSTTSCDSADCHPDVFSSTDSIVGHDEEHQDVSCVACHDSAGWEVGPDEELGYWITYIPWVYEINVGEADTIVETGIIPFTSHEIVLEAPCERCHFSENPWGLEESVEAP